MISNNVSVPAVSLYPCVSRPNSLHILVLHTFLVPPNLMRSFYDLGVPVSGCSTLHACKSVCSSVAIIWLSAAFEITDCVWTRVGYLALISNCLLVRVGYLRL